MSRNPSTLTSATNHNLPQRGMDVENVFVPDANEVKHTRGIQELNAAEEPEQLDANEAERQKPRGETEPHGMYWHRQDGRLILKPHAWFLVDVAATAEHVLVKAIDDYGKCKATQQLIRDMSEALRSYIECRTAINDMAGARKLKGEADDACYQLTQAAKYFIDAQQAAQRCIDGGYNVDDNQKVQDLKARSKIAMREGYMIAQAVILAASTPPVFDMKQSAKRVVEYSCRRLTEWFSAKRENEANKDANRNKGAALDLESFLSR